MHVTIDGGPHGPTRDGLLSGGLCASRLVLLCQACWLLALGSNKVRVLSSATLAALRAPGSHVPPEHGHGEGGALWVVSGPERAARLAALRGPSRCPECSCSPVTRLSVQ